MVKNKSFTLSQTTFLLICALLFYRSPHAEDYLSPATIEGSTTINAEALIEMAREHDDLVIIDSRLRADRRQGYIADSVSLPDVETDCSTLFRMIYRKKTPVVFYCNGPKCRRSDNAVKVALECGYSSIYWFRGGFEEWLAKNYIIHK